MADFGGRYRLDRRLGAGGMGEVWLAYDEELGDRPVAVKVMRAGMLADDVDLARFQREMRLASRMQHPNIMTVFTTGSDHGVPFMVMEYLQGSDLGKLPVGRSADEVARIGAETCAALAYAHGLDPGVVHRDVKPGNLFICDTGTVKVTDFGLAKAATETRISIPGTVLGTMPYISPEQWLGAPLAFSDDIWAVGSVLYELLSGRLPRAYENPVEYCCAAARREPVAPLPETVPAGLADAVMAMLDVDPLARPTARQATALLSAWRAHPVSAQAAPPQAPPRPPATTRQQSTRHEVPPTRHEMALAGSRLQERGGAEPTAWPSQSPSAPPPAPMGQVTSVQERQETSQAQAPTQLPIRRERHAKPAKRRRLLISAIAGLGVVGVGIYAAVWAFSGPAVSTSSSSGAPVPQSASASAKEIAYKMLPSFDFNQTTQWPCLVILWGDLSDWNVGATNVSGAYGIPQAPDGGVAMAADGPDWRTDAATQIKWGLGYIKETYGTPCSAWQYEESNGSY